MKKVDCHFGKDPFIPCSSAEHIGEMAPDDYIPGGFFCPGQIFDLLEVAVFEADSGQSAAAMPAEGKKVVDFQLHGQKKRSGQTAAERLE